MKLLINASNNLTGGSLQVAISFINECQKFTNYEYVVVLGDNICKQIDVSIFPMNFKFYTIKSNPFYKLGYQLKKIEFKEKPDRVFTIFGPSYWRPNAKHIMGLAILDLFFNEIKSIWFDKFSIKDKIMWFTKKKLHSFYVNRDADVIISETATASNMFKRTCKSVKSFYVVSNNCSNFYWKFEKGIVKNYADTNEFKLLMLSRYRPNKNFECIPKVIDELHKRNIYDIKFILTIDDNIFRNKFYKYSENIINVGAQKANDCPVLYEKCDAMFLPTYLECFSASYPEAMVMHKPILTSDLDFAHDICGDAALYFNPDDPEDIALKIIELKTNTQLYNELIKRGGKKLMDFPSPEEKAKQYLDIIFEK